MNEALTLITHSNRLSQILSLKDENAIYENLSQLYEHLQSYVGKNLLEEVNDSLSRTIQAILLDTNYIPHNNEVLKLLYKIDESIIHFDNLYQDKEDCFFKIMNLRKKLVLKEVLQYSSHEKRLLDIGCAEGIFLHGLKERFKERFGIDISCERLERLNEKDPEVQTFCLDLNQDKINLEDASVDIIPNFASIRVIKLKF